MLHPRPTLPFAPKHRARFDALRQQLFGEMGQAAARWRLVWVIPFYVASLGLLYARGESQTRVIVQGVAFTGATLLFVKLAHGRRALHKFPSLFVGATLCLATVATTGGLASPMLVMCLPLLFAAAVQPISTRARIGFFAFFGISILALAVASGTAVGELNAPLTPMGVHPSAEYVVVATGAMLITISAIYVAGRGISRVYERVGLELAERREEICYESEDRTRALEGIAARLAHEVKNPLAAIKGLSTHVARNATDPKVAERLAIVAAEADRLQAIVDEFLSFSRGLDELQVGPVVPYALARELTVLMETRAEESGVKLDVTGSEELVLNADGRKLRQALLNLVLNAMQASPRGETVTIDVAKCCGGAACIKVTDRGAGMTPEVLDRIRKPYYTTREGGTGLGVAVSRGLIEQHGGQLHYDSKPGRGTTVTIDMPACAMAAAKARKLPNPVREHVTS